MKEAIKTIILPVFHIIQKTLSVFKNHVLPVDSKKRPTGTTSYKIFCEEEITAGYEHFKKYFYKAIFLEREKIREYAIKQALRNDIEQTSQYLEFGVYTGSSVNKFAQYLKGRPIYGFDSFRGLREDWVGHELSFGTFDLDGKVPKLNKNVIPIKGWVQDTLPGYLQEHQPKIQFVHMDMDTYESTKFVLENIKPFLSKNSIIIFDELYNFAGWRVGEYKALTEVFEENEYKFLAFAKSSAQAVIQVL
ncbi:MAG: class I SAM-dependent methyltransferase [Candidatus Melainabacteria bacterium]|jgi:hypothetical protein|nr:class I SAM-dependent methyltransferase [Candidatus Melainabacteria bacterium]